MSEIKGIEIRDLAGLSQPLTKLVECVSTGIGKLYEPIYRILLSKAKTYEMTSSATVMRENIDIPMKCFDEHICIDSSVTKEILLRAEMRKNYQNICAEQNIAAIISNAYEELEKEECVPDEPIDTMWALRFFKSIEDITDETLRKMWGRILAGEIKQPKSFSLRTLSVLQDISQNEALLFQKIASLVLGDNNKAYFIFNSKDLNKKYGCSVKDVLDLDECGLINAKPTLSINLNVSKERPAKLLNNKIIVKYKTKSDTSKIISLNIFSLSEAGVQLYKVIDKEVNENYIIDYYKTIYTENEEYDVSICNVTSI